MRACLSLDTGKSISEGRPEAEIHKPVLIMFSPKTFAVFDRVISSGLYMQGDISQELRSAKREKF